MSQFSYSRLPNPAASIYGMTQGNSAPALIVWLFLVTHPSFLVALDNVTNPDGEFDVTFTDSKLGTINIQEISNMTNLTPDAVRTILRDGYMKNAALKPAFSTVVSSFQAFAAESVSRWDPDECPGVLGISKLAQSGATVDPTS